MMGSNTLDLSDLQAWQDLAQNEGRECVIGAVILNAQGRAFIQKRSHERGLFPGCWDIVGGHVEPGETVYEGLHREIAEETGWHLARVVAILGQFDWEADQKAKRELDVLVEVEGDRDTPQSVRAATHPITCQNLIRPVEKIKSGTQYISQIWKNSCFLMSCLS